MADVITRLKLESGEYDSKVKRATQGLLQMEQECRNAGKSLATLEKEQKQYVQSLGSMQTVSTTVRGKLGELTQAYTELRVQYNRLTEEEKKGDFGKALSSSLDQLNQRIQQTKKELSDVNKELSGMDKLEAGGLFGGSKISGMLQVFGGNVMTKVAGMATGLVTELGDCIKQGVELAKQGEGIRIAFERLGRGDILDGLREATHGTVTDLELMKAAVKFNDFKLPLDELGTMLTFAQQKAKDTGQSVDYMVDSIVTGLGRKSLMILDNLGLSAAEIKERMKETGDMTKAVGAIIRDQMAKSGDYVETAADRAAQADVQLKNAMEELGRTFQPLADAGTSMWTALETGALKFLTKIGAVIAQMTEAGRIAAQYGDMGGSDRVGSQISAYQNAKDKNSYRKAVLASYDAQIRQREKVLAGIDAWRSGDRSAASRAAFDKMEQYGVGRGDNAALRAQINALRKQRDEFSRGAVESTVSPITNPNGPKKETKKELTELQQNQQKINDLTQEYVKLGDESTQAARERQAEIQKEIAQLEKRNGLLGLRAEQAQGRLLGGDIQMSGLNMNPGTLLKSGDMEIPKGGFQLSDKAMKALEKNITKSLEASKKNETSIVKEIGGMTGGVSQIVGGLEQLGIEIPAGLQSVIGGMQAITGILTGIATTILAIEALVGTDTFLPFAGGGIVRAAGGTLVGNSYSGDNLRGIGPGGQIYGLNAGEVVLNRAQAGVLANELQGGAMGNLGLSVKVTAEELRFILGNNSRRRGKGEYVTTNRLR